MTIRANTNAARWSRAISISEGIDHSAFHTEIVVRLICIKSFSGCWIFFTTRSIFCGALPRPASLNLGFQRKT